jgi:6-phosphogluconolactonase
MKNDPSLCGRMIRAKQFPDSQVLTAAVTELLRQQFTTGPDTDHAIMLAGGSTPMAAYSAIAANPFRPNPRLHLFFSDDRYVPPDSPKSNYGNTLPMIRALGIPDGNVFRVHGEEPIARATEKFGGELDAFTARGGRVTVGFLGLGADGHTASLFNKDHIEQGRGRTTIAVKRPDGMEGVSVTADFLSRVERIVFLVSGAEKKEMSRKLLKESLTIPAGMAVAGCASVELWSDPSAWPL